MALFAGYDNFSTDKKNAGEASMGLLIFASFFGIPYLVFFRPKSKDKPGKKTLSHRRCKNCSSTEFESLKDGGIQCKHCGSIYS